MGAAPDPSRRQPWPHWLTEGIADFVGQSAAAEAGVVEGDVFDTGGLTGVDRAPASRARADAKVGAMISGA